MAPSCREFNSAFSDVCITSRTLLFLAWQQKNWNFPRIFFKNCFLEHPCSEAALFCFSAKKLKRSMFNCADEKYPLQCECKILRSDSRTACDSTEKPNSADFFDFLQFLASFFSFRRNRVITFPWKGIFCWTRPSVFPCNCAKETQIQRKNGWENWILKKSWKVLVFLLSSQK